MRLCLILAGLCIKINKIMQQKKDVRVLSAGENHGKTFIVKD